MKTRKILSLALALVLVLVAAVPVLAQTAVYTAVRSSGGIEFTISNVAAQKSLLPSDANHLLVELGAETIKEAIMMLPNTSADFKYDFYEAVAPAKIELTKGTLTTFQCGNRFMQSGGMTFYPVDLGDRVLQPGTYFTLDEPGVYILRNGLAIEDHFFVIVSEGTPVTAPPLDSASDWAKPGITEALEKGFVPLDIQDNYQSVITRQEFCRMAVMWLEYKLEKGIDAIVAEYGVPERMNRSFSDTDDPNILAAYRLGVTAGSVGPTDDKPGEFNPNGQFTRQEAATMIMYTCKAAGFDVADPPTADFKDMGSVADWAKPGVNFVKDNGIMAGDGTNFNPAETYSRQHSIITLNNIK